MRLPIDRCEQPERVLVARQQCGRIKLGHGREFARARCDSSRKKITRRSEESFHLWNHCRRAIRQACAWENSQRTAIQCSRNQRPCGQRPGIVTLAAVQREWSCGRARARYAGKVSVKQMIPRRNQPSPQISRPRPFVGDRQFLLRLPLSALQSIERNLLRVEYGDVRWRWVFIQNRDIEDGFVLR